MRIHDVAVAENRRGANMQGSDPDIWALLFEQTPRALRWVFGLLTFGVFSLAALIWKWQREDTRRVENDLQQKQKEMHERIDREMAGIHSRLDHIYEEIIRANRDREK